MGRMDQAPYESPRDISDRPARQWFPWKWLLLAGVLTAVLSYLGFVALILAFESPTGVDMPFAGVVTAGVLLSLMALGALLTVVSAIGWLLSWIWR
jgi:hypothetical protein